MFLHCNIIENTNILNNSDYIALSAIFVSISSVMISIIYNRKTYKLSKINTVLSKKPLLAAKIFSDIKTGEIEVGIENNGLGPAIIKEIKFKSEHLESKKCLDVFEKIKLKDGSHLVFHLKDTLLGQFTNKYSISEKKYILLYKAIITNPSTSTKNLVINHIKKCEMLITYSDIFGNEFEKTEKIGVE